MGLKITNAAGDMPVVWLYGDIDKDIAVEFAAALSEIPSKQAIEVRIHSDGGNFDSSIAMYNSLRRRSGPSSVVIDGAAYSGGSVVAMGGTTVEMLTGSWMMIHEAEGTMKGGQAVAFREAADMLDATNKQLIQVYSPRWKGTAKELADALAKNLWMHDTQAVEYGLADKISDGKFAVAAYCNREKILTYRNVPEELVATTPENPFPTLAKRELRLQELELTNIPESV